MPDHRHKSANQRKPRTPSGRSEQKQPGDEPDVSSGSKVDDAATPPSTGAEVSFFITRAQKALLRKMGYSDEQIAQMKPAEAHRILAIL
jgi:hypothetical protein